VKHVVIASGETNLNSQFEAATAPGLAGAYNAPVLLLPKSSLRSDVRAALIAMPNGLRVHIVGGTAGISTSVLRRIRSLPGVSSVDRVAGTNRFGTAAAVARRMKSVLGSKMPKSALITGASSAGNAPDAVVASVVSYRQHFPLLYVTKTSVPSATGSALANLGLTKRYILGDVSVVSATVQGWLHVAPADRIVGAGWKSTAVNFAQRAKAEGWLAAKMLGYVSNMSDATGIGAFLGSRSAPLMGVNPTSVPSVTLGYLTANKETINGGYVFGPASSVSEAVRLRLLQLIR
jgi:hypothetical protein